MLRIVPDDKLPALTSAAHCKRHPFPLAFALWLHAGLRLQESRQLAWADLIFLDKVHQALNLQSYATKNNRTRIVPINQTLMAAIHSAWFNHAKDANMSPANYALARTRDGKPLSARQLERTLQSIGQAALGTKITPHTLRHTFATRLLKVSNLRTVQQALGHKSVQTTQIYTHVNTDDLAQAVARLDPPGPRNGT